MISARDWIGTSTIDRMIWDRWPHYQVWLVAADGVDVSRLAFTADDLFEQAIIAARSDAAVDGHVLRWQDAYRDFGVKPRVARSSIDALLRRARSDNGLPRINVLVDMYNAISILHIVPIGGEDLDRYDGPARLHIASGDEPFHTTSHGEPVIEHPEPGEPIWVDDTGITCRRWNWRQTTRTAIDPATRRVGFIIDSLDAPTTTALDTPPTTWPNSWTTPTSARSTTRETSRADPPSRRRHQRRRVAEPAHHPSLRNPDRARHEPRRTRRRPHTRPLRRRHHDPPPPRPTQPSLARTAREPALPVPRRRCCHLRPHLLGSATRHSARMGYPDLALRSRRARLHRHHHRRPRRHPPLPRRPPLHHATRRTPRRPTRPAAPYTTELRQIRGLELTIDTVRAKFKFDGAEPDHVRQEVADGYRRRDTPSDREALDHLLRRHPPANP